MSRFMTVPEGKHFGRYDDFWLASFMFNAKNVSLKSAFEKAAGVEIGWEGACVGIVGDNCRDVELAKDALDALSKEMRTIHQEQFDHVVTKLKLVRGK